MNYLFYNPAWIDPIEYVSDQEDASDAPVISELLLKD